MDCRDYTKLQKRYYELNHLAFHEGAAREEIISRLTEASNEKKKIRMSCDSIIREYVGEYEKNPENVTAEAEKRLKEFMEVLLSPDEQVNVDIAIIFRTAKLLLHYYRKMGDKENIIDMLERCAVCDLVMKEHLDSHKGSVYPSLAGQYIDDMDCLSESAQGTLLNCWFYGVIARRNIDITLSRYKEISDRFEKIQLRKGKEFGRIPYALFKNNTLNLIMEACFEAEKEEKDGAELEVSEEVRRYVQELQEDLRKTLESEGWQEIYDDRVEAWSCCTLADYYQRKITLNDLLNQIEAYIEPKEDYNPSEQCTALFTMSSAYLDYLGVYRRREKKSVVQKGMEVMEHVMKSVKDVECYLGHYQTNERLLALLKSASAIVDFDVLQNAVLNAAIYTDKALYVHTLMVKEISSAILSYILEHDPQYLDGVGGYAAEEETGYRDKMMKLMERCALFHDIGKYFCLDYVSNSSRSLTDDEFEIVKEHPSNFSKIYQGEMNREVECIHDCALFHHLWYNEKGGYPKGKHTANKPFVNILSIADSIDATTDNIGRPYEQGKTFSQMLEELEGMKDSRYSGYVCDLLHTGPVRQEIEYILDNRRKDIYCDVYLSF